MAIQLGDRVKDIISGLKGIAIGRTEWLHGCMRITVQPEGVKDGKPIDYYTVDEPQLEVLKTGIITRQQATPPGGPMPNTPRR